MSRKRVLIVDDDPDLLFLAAHGVKSLGPDFQVITAVDGHSALEQAKKQQFDLVITDYMMPEMTGLELVQAVRQLSSDTLFILMTAHHDTSGMRDEVEDLALAGFVGKPFSMPDLLGTIKGVIEKIDVVEPEKPDVSLSSVGIQEQLKNLKSQIVAHSVLLVNADGKPLYTVGITDKVRSARLASFVSTNFLAITELASLFGDTDTVFSSSYYEGNKYNIYACNINGEYFLAVVFDANSKPGTVWFYTKQMATELASKLPSASKSSLTNKASASLSKDFDDLFGNEVNDS